MQRSHAVKKATINALAPYREHTHTITNDNGKEFAEHIAIAEKLDCNVYFCHPYSSWERGLNEYTNKLLRQYFPKGICLDNVSRSSIYNAVNKLNNRPRKKLGFKTPKEVFYSYIYKNQSLALSG